jgi:hypothetical protein
MSWKCAVCGELDGRNKAVVNGVCHHCGKPLCTKHQVIVRDPDFGHDKENPRVRAVHCKECRKKHHRLALRQRKQSKP